jgi:hypothetical protein
MTDKIAMAAMKNKTVQSAVKKQLFESVVGKDQAEAEDNQRTHDASVIQGHSCSSSCNYFCSPTSQTAETHMISLEFLTLYLIYFTF